MRSVKNMYCRAIFSFIIMAASHAHADVVFYKLDNVQLADDTQMHGTFSWTFDVDDFEGGVGSFITLGIPWRPTSTLPPLEDPNMVLQIENNQIEISLDGSLHDYGLDIGLKFVQPLSPTRSSLIDPNTSFFECCGNGFKDQSFQSGSISLINPVPEPSGFLLFPLGLATFGLVIRRRRSRGSLHSLSSVTVE